MSPENNFLAFYDIHIDLNDFKDQIMDEISYDIGTRHIGTGIIPVNK